ncbi:2-dehydropantoate 2-reductase [Puccinia triticina 1-1 BBBD Race 1]|uniref:2-dehydropantoate 2-reductase n=1 Tax=Puccinia triticina (isolate 1-1 / race 1 (BBBD)) TaxID=630390 RepID=A0A180G9G1_PUCT1|nr:2-dehydropantoate 2-reductase [Puccinia triticina 1-1 BBBD Race 1]
MESETNILIVGAGAVGAFYGSRLHRPEAGAKVSFVCRSNYEAVQTEGIEISSRTYGTYRVRPTRVFESVERAAELGPSSGTGTGRRSGWDFVVLCTKVLPDRVDDPALLAPLLKTPDDGRHPPTLVLIQNGIGFEDAHRQRHPQVPILSAVTVVNAEQLQPGCVRHNQWTRISIGPYLSFSAYLDHPHPPVTPQLALHSQTQLELLAKLLRNGQINDAEIYGERELQILRWHKLAINASMNPTSILSGGMASSEMVKDGGLREHLAGCMGEVFGAALQIFGLAEFPAEFASIEQILRSTERAGERATIKPSMLLDWEASRPLETEVILGNPLRIANRAGINLARIQSMYAFLTQLQLARAKKADINHARI